MKIVHLRLPCEEDTFSDVDLTVDFTDAELSLISQYNTYTKRIRSSTLLQRGMSGFEGLTFDKDGLEIRAGACSLPELYELLHVLRPVTLEKERASFTKVTTIFERRLNDQLALDFLKINKHAFQHGEMSLYLQITVDGKRLFDELLLRMWLNGTQYHSDVNKAEDWTVLEETLGESSARAVVMSQLHAKIMAILNIDYVASQILVAPKNDA